MCMCVWGVGGVGVHVCVFVYVCVFVLAAFHAFHKFCGEFHIVFPFFRL